MKISNYILIAAFLPLISCSRNPVVEQKQPAAYGEPIYFGKHITEDSAIDCNELKDRMGSSIVYPAKIKGEVIGTCQDKSCMLQIDLGDGTSMNVKMNNSQVEVPKDINGKTAIIEGKAYIDTSSVKINRGYDSISGRSIAETEATKNPEVSLAFDATGLIIK
jgi:hypothetical protein